MATRIYLSDMRKAEPLERISGHIEEEARMVLPGIQALFGFQLIAVFNQRFDQLSSLHQEIHLFALAFTAISIAFALTPAAFHRIAEPDVVSACFCRFGTWCLSLALVPLILGTCSDLFIIADLILSDGKQSLAFALIIFTLLTSIWFIIPLYMKWRVGNVALDFPVEMAE